MKHGCSDVGSLRCKNIRDGVWREITRTALFTEKIEGKIQLRELEAEILKYISSAAKADGQKEDN
jgi:hypothetical protein